MPVHGNDDIVYGTYTYTIPDDTHYYVQDASNELKSVSWNFELPEAKTPTYVTKNELEKILKDFAELVEQRTHIIINQDDIEKILNG